MNDNTKVLDQNPSIPSAPIQPVPGVGGANKEAVRPVVAPVSEFVRPSGAETVLNLPPEVSSANVKVQSDRPDLTFEHKQIGLNHANPPVSIQSSNSIQLPMSEEEMAQKLETGQDDDSGKSLAKLLKKIFKF